MSKRKPDFEPFRSHLLKGLIMPTFVWLGATAWGEHIPGGIHFGMFLLWFWYIVLLIRANRHLFRDDQNR